MNHRQLFVSKPWILSKDEMLIADSLKLDVFSHSLLAYACLWKEGYSNEVIKQKLRCTGWKILKHYAVISKESQKKNIPSYIHYSYLLLPRNGNYWSTRKKWFCLELSIAGRSCNVSEKEKKFLGKIWSFDLLLYPGKSHVMLFSSVACF